MIVKMLSLLAMMFTLFAFCRVAHAQQNLSRCGNTPPAPKRVGDLDGYGQVSWCICQGRNTYGTSQLVEQRVTTGLFYKGSGDEMWTADGWNDYTAFNSWDDYDLTDWGPGRYDGGWLLNSWQYDCSWRKQPAM